MEEQHFRSGIGWGILLFVSLVLAGVWILASLDGFSTTEVAVLACISILLLAYLVYLNLGIRYIIGEEDLLIHLPLIYEKRVVLKDIVSLKSTRDLSAAPAPAMRRMEISLSDGSRILISPSNAKEFSQSLRQRVEARRRRS